MKIVSSETRIVNTIKMIPQSIEDLVEYMKNPQTKTSVNGEIPIWPIIDRGSFTEEYLVMDENGDVYQKERKINHNNAKCHEPVLLWKGDDSTYGGWKEKWNLTDYMNPRNSIIEIEKIETIKNI